MSYPMVPLSCRSNLAGRYQPLTEALGEVGLLVEKDLGGDDGPEGEKGLVEVRIRELRWQVVDEQVGSFRSLVRL